MRKNKLLSHAEQRERIQACIDEIQESTPYADSLTALKAAADEYAIATIDSLAKKLLAQEPTLFLLIGIGGSNMGALAILQAFYAEMPPLRFLCADTIDQEQLTWQYAQVEAELQRGGRVLVAIISKSGTTTETLVNASFFIELLKRYYKQEYHKSIIAITDQESPLWQLAQKKGFHLLSIPTLVGGRFSIFTAAGLFPLALQKIDIKAFCQGAQQAYAQGMRLLENSVADTAITLYDYYNNGYVIHDSFLFCPNLISLGLWYKQLIGESLGKKYALNGSLVEVGFTPTVSFGTVDLHSVVQLYLAGPHNRVTTFIAFQDEPSTFVVPDNEASQLLVGMAGRSVTQIKQSIEKAVMRAYQASNRPYLTDSVTYKDLNSFGYFMLNKMLETIFLGRLFGINPFDQPAVELYKKEIRSFFND